MKVRTHISLRGPQHVSSCNNERDKYVIIIPISPLYLGVFYYTLGNLHPKHRSTLDGICLLAIVMAYGIDVILEPIVAAIQKLEVWI